MLSLQPGGQNAGVEVTALQPRLANASVLICSHLFWPKHPAAELDLKVPGAPSDAVVLRVTFAWSCGWVQTHLFTPLLAKASRG